MTSFNQQTDQSIKKKIQDELVRFEENNEKRTFNQRIQSRNETLPVIELPLSYVFLRAENNRISVEIDELDNSEDILTNNRSHEAQEKIERFLAETERFDELKNQIQSVGQTTPCIITYDGLLVDGNTRCSALKQLQREGDERQILVAVLTEEQSSNEVITDIEVNNQLIIEVKQGYSFSNRLIWQRKIRVDMTDEQLAKKMGYVRVSSCIKRIERDERMLGYIDEMRSYKDGLGYSFFDDKEEVLKNLDDALQRATLQNDVQEEQQIRYTRYIGIMSDDLTKDMVRNMEDDFLDEFYKGQDSKDSNSKEIIDFVNDCLNQPEPSPDDDILGLSHNEEYAVDPEKLLRKIFDPAKEDDMDHKNRVGELFAAVRGRAEVVVNTNRNKRAFREPEKFLRNARDNLKENITALRNMYGKEGFKPGGVEYQLNHLLDDVIDAISDFAEHRAGDRKRRVKTLEKTISKLQTKLKKYK